MCYSLFDFEKSLDSSKPLCLSCKQPKNPLIDKKCLLCGCILKLDSKREQIDQCIFTKCIEYRSSLERDGVFFFRPENKLQDLGVSRSDWQHSTVDSLMVVIHSCTSDYNPIRLHLAVEESVTLLDLINLFHFRLKYSETVKRVYWNRTPNKDDLQEIDFTSRGRLVKEFHNGNEFRKVLFHFLLQDPATHHFLFEENNYIVAPILRTTNVPVLVAPNRKPSIPCAILYHDSLLKLQTFRCFASYQLPIKQIVLAFNKANPFVHVPEKVPICLYLLITTPLKQIKYKALSHNDVETEYTHSLLELSNSFTLSFMVPQSQEFLKQIHF
jgi:hypothetical protein